MSSARTASAASWRRASLRHDGGSDEAARQVPTGGRLGDRPRVVRCRGCRSAAAGSTRAGARGAREAGARCPRVSGRSTFRSGQATRSTRRGSGVCGSIAFSRRLACAGRLAGRSGRGRASLPQRALRSAYRVISCPRLGDGSGRFQPTQGGFHKPSCVSAACRSGEATHDHARGSRPP